MKSNLSLCRAMTGAVILTFTPFLTLGAERAAGATEVPNLPPAKEPSSMGTQNLPGGDPSYPVDAKAGLSVHQRQNVRLSFWADQILRLAEAGVDETVQLSFIDNSAGEFSLGADQIILLSGKGVSPEILSAMLQHDFEITAGLRSLPGSITPTLAKPLEIVLVPRSEIKTEDTPAAAEPQPAETVPDDNALMPAVFTTLEVPEQKEVPNVFVGTPPTPARLVDRPLYSVRDPHPVTVAAPLIIIRGVVLAPNVQVVEMR